MHNVAVNKIVVFFQEGRRKGVINYPVIEKPAAISSNQPGQSKPDGGQPKLGTDY